MKEIRGLLFCIAIFASVAFFFTRTGSISDIQSFDEVDFSQLGLTGSLVLFDVDQTLIHQGNLYMSNADSYHENPPLIEPSIIEKIELLKKRQISILAITAMNTGKSWQHDRLEKWRYDHLKELGFEGDFDDLDFDIRGFKRHPVFYKGIIVTDGEHKGPVMGVVLDRLSLTPNEIIMFDDRLGFLESVEAECKGRHIPFHGYHYLGAEDVVKR